MPFISLCLQGKTKLKGLYKAEGDGGKKHLYLHASMAKAIDEQGLLTCCFYPPNMPDEEGWWASPETIQRIAHHATGKGISLDIYHDEEPIPFEKASIAESFIIQETDSRFDGMPGPEGPLSAKDLAGGWGGVIHLKDEGLRKSYKEGAVSIGGDAWITENDPPAKLEKASSSSVLGAFRKALRSLMRSSKEQGGGGLTGLSLNVNLPRPGETDYDGRPRRPELHLSISSDMD